ncbi:recombination regulator RecX [Ramlibacter sp.]|uniref:recombination regulator RecX n=1 Tax=Ramlibacter sp. TaxID=1917967 RepID=UPI003D0F23E1
MAFGQLSLKGRALKLLAAREHSRAELERKLAEHEEEPGQIQRVLDELARRGFIDEKRVAEALVHRRGPKLGAGRIRHELQSRGVDEDVVAEAVAGLRATELERAREVWRKKFGEAPENAVERGRQMRFLAARGFGGEVIRRVLSPGDDRQ